MTGVVGDLFLNIALFGLEIPRSIPRNMMNWIKLGYYFGTTALGLCLNIPIIFPSSSHWGGLAIFEPCYEYTH